MAAARTEFTDAQKAEIYCRDRATCAFTGKSLWVLDHGISPFYDVDWVDHIRPSSRNGKATLENGVCASSFANSKKKNNGSDNAYLFKDGRPTHHFLWNFGMLPKETADQLLRLSKLSSSDWYFNRAVCRIFNAFKYRCEIDFGVAAKTRKEPYWYGAAWRFLDQWKKYSKDEESFEHRGLIRKPHPYGADEILLIRKAASLNDMIAQAELMYPKFHANYKAVWDFSDCESKARAVCYLDQLSSANISGDVFIALKSYMHQEKLWHA